MKYLIVGTTNIHIFLIDKKQLQRIQQHNWTAHPQNNGDVYAQTYINGKKQSLHRFVLDIDDISIYVDHIDGNTRDCRERNLRQATALQNTQNKKKQKNPVTSVYKGVFWREDRHIWVAGIRVNTKFIYLGCYRNEEEAGHVYDVAAIKYFGEFAKLNFS